MKKCLVLIILLMAGSANATWNWEGDVSSAWSDWENWNNGTVSPPGSAHSATEGMYIPNTTLNSVNADISDTMGTLHMSRGGTVGNATVNLNTAGVVLTVSTATGELVSVAYSDNVTSNLNVSAGRLNVYRGTGAGELRLNHIYNATCKGNLNLSGTGVVDVEYLNKGSRDAGGNFSATGGTLIVRNSISKFGVAKDGYTGFNLGGATLEIANWSDRNAAVGSIGIGLNEKTDFFMDSTSKIKFDLGLSANNGGAAGTDYDLITSRGNITIAGELIVNLLEAVEIGDYWDVWVIGTSYVTEFDGSGSFANLPDNIVASWIDTGTGNDTLRLTYIPEPATLALLSLGMFVIRRKK